MWPQCPIHGFKLATSTFVLSTLDLYLHSHIPQVLHFYYIIPEQLSKYYIIPEQLSKYYIIPEQLSKVQLTTIIRVSNYVGICLTLLPRMKMIFCIICYIQKILLSKLIYQDCIYLRQNTHSTVCPIFSSNNIQEKKVKD